MPPIDSMHKLLSFENKKTALINENVCDDCKKIKFFRYFLSNFYLTIGIFLLTQHTVNLRLASQQSKILFKSFLE